MYNNQNQNNRYPDNQNNRAAKAPASKRTDKKNTKKQAPEHTDDYYYDYVGYTNSQKRYTAPYRYERHKRTWRERIAKHIYRILLLIIFVCTIAGIISTLFYFYITGSKSLPDISYEITAPDMKDPSKINLPFDMGFVNGKYYIPINDLMNILNCKISGDKNEITFTSADTLNFMKFKVNSSVVYINNVEYHISSPTFLVNSESNDDKLYVPLEFIQNKFNNIKIIYDEKNANHITVEVLDTENFVFALQLLESLKNPGEGIEYTPIQFKSDLSEYEQYFAPENPNEYVTLINQTNSLDSDYVPADLIDVIDTRKDGRVTQQLRLYAAKALEALLIESRANGIENITVTSGYRSYATQESLFNTRVAEQMAILGDQQAAEIEVAKLVAYPGKSEHQSGLCADMHTLGSALEIFGDTPAGIWLAENAHNFGFILRYPADKTHITKISYEPWHFRYVGRFHATRMYDLGMCLEEYTEYLDKTQSPFS